MSGIPSWAKLGTQVVCVDASARGQYDPPGWDFNHDLDGLAEGPVYTLRDVFVHRGRMLVRLNEIHRSTGLKHGYWRGAEYAYAIERFRPLTATKSQAEDVAVFKRIAKTPNPALQLDFSPYEVS